MRNHEFLINGLMLNPNVEIGICSQSARHIIKIQFQAVADKPTNIGILMIAAKLVRASTIRVQINIYSCMTMRCPLDMCSVAC